MQDLKVTLVQTPLYWQNAQANLGMLEEKVWQIDEDTDLIVLPEMFNSGFTMQPELVSEPMNFTTFKWMKQIAAQTKAVVTGSFVVKENNQYYNRLIWMQPDGNWESYDKRHLFRMANEHDHYTAGNSKIVIELKGWKICPLICYDLRFPVWARNDVNNPYDLLLFVANWPAARVDAWDALLKARAIENLSYTIGVNRIGEDGNNVAYNGHSSIYGPKGDVISYLDDKEEINTYSLSKDILIKFREKFPAHLDADEFTID